jgi:hypothetical protein
MIDNMPNRITHERFDEFLANKGILLSDARYGNVHRFMDTGVKIYGPDHRNYDPYHERDGICTWITGKRNVINQDHATDWVRSALGHICLDKAATRFKNKKRSDYSEDALFKSAYRSNVQKGWTRARFVRR